MSRTSSGPTVPVSQSTLPARWGLQATVHDTNSALSVAASVSAAISLASLALTGAGASSANTVDNTVSAFIQGADAAHKSVVTAKGDITVNSTETATIDAQVGTGAGAGGVAGGSIGISIAQNAITSSITSYVDNASLTSSGGKIDVTADSDDQVTTLSVATSIAIALGGAGAGGNASVDVSPEVDAYAGSGATLSAAKDISVKATSTNSAQAQTYGAALGLVAVGSSITHASANGSVSSSVQGEVTGCSNLFVEATATDSSDAGATGLSGGVGAGSGAESTATTLPTVEAYTGSKNVTATQEIQISATITPSAKARAQGVAVAGMVAVGASIAHAAVAPKVKSHVGGASGTITAAGLMVSASQNLPGGGASSDAEAIGAAGGALIGVSVAGATNGTGSDKAEYTCYVAEGAILSITGATSVSVDSTSRQRAVADNYNLGAVAAGAGVSDASSNTINHAYFGNNVRLTGSSLNISATGQDTNNAKVVAGSGGIVAGPGEEANTSNTSSTTAEIGSGDGVHGIDLTGVGTGTAQVLAKHTATFNAQEVTFAGGGLVGSGAQITNNVDSDVAANVGNSALLRAKSISVQAENHVDKPTLPDVFSPSDTTKTGPNILGDTGGLAAAAGAVSVTGLRLTTKVTIGSHANLEVVGNLSAPGTFVLSALNDIVANDKVTLNTGGALADAGAFSTIKALTDFYTNQVNRITAELRAQGLLDQAGNTNFANRQCVITVDVDDVFADAGIIDVRTGYLQGTGTLDTPGNASVSITNNTPAFLVLHRITIPQTNGRIVLQRDACGLQPQQSDRPGRSQQHRQPERRQQGDRAGGNGRLRCVGPARHRHAAGDHRHQHLRSPAFHAVAHGSAGRHVSGAEHHGGGQDRCRRGPAGNRQSQRHRESCHPGRQGKRPHQCPVAGQRPLGGHRGRRLHQRRDAVFGGRGTALAVAKRRRSDHERRQPDRLPGRHKRDCRSAEPAAGGQQHGAGQLPQPRRLARQQRGQRRADGDPLFPGDLPAVRHRWHLHAQLQRDDDRPNPLRRRRGRTPGGPQRAGAGQHFHGHRRRHAGQSVPRHQGPGDRQPRRTNGGRRGLRRLRADDGRPVGPDRRGEPLR